MAELVFRPMRMTDRAEIQDFFDSMGAASAAFFNVNHGNERRTMAFFETGKPDHRFFIAADGERAAGLLFIWDIDTSVPWLGVAVRDDYQGKGVGSFLLEQVFALLRREGYGGLLLRTAQTNLAAQRLYERRGFERLGEHPSGEYLYLKRFEREERA